MLLKTRIKCPYLMANKHSLLTKNMLIIRCSKLLAQTSTTNRFNNSIVLAWMKINQILEPLTIILTSNSNQTKQSCNSKHTKKLRLYNSKRCRINRFRFKWTLSISCIVNILIWRWYNTQTLSQKTINKSWTIIY